MPSKNIRKFAKDSDDKKIKSRTKARFLSIQPSIDKEPVKHTMHTSYCTSTYNHTDPDQYHTVGTNHTHRNEDHFRKIFLIGNYLQLNIIDRYISFLQALWFLEELSLCQSLISCRGRCEGLKVGSDSSHDV